MAELPLILALVLTLAAGAGAVLHGRTYAAMVGLAWLALVGGFVALYADVIGGPGAALAIAAVAGVASLPVAVGDGTLRARMALAGAGVPLLVALAGLLVGADASPRPGSGTMLLHAAQWAALTAALTAAAASAAAQRRGEGLGWLAAAALGGALIVGFGRPGLAGVGYALPVVAESGPVVWELAGFRGFEEGLRLGVAHPAPLAAYGAVAGVVLALLLGISALLAPRMGRRLARLGAFLSALVAVSATGGLAGIYTAAGSVALPDSTPFVDATRQALSSAGADVRAIEAAAFSSDAAGALSFGDVAPDLVGFGLALIFGLLGLWFGLRGRDRVDPVARLYARDHAVRAVALGWLAWFLGTLTHIRFFGATGIGAPGEWVALGGLLLASGVVAIGWRPTGVLSAAVARASGGVLGALLLLVAAMAARFGAVFGLSIGFY